MNSIKNEPVIAAILLVIAASIALLVSFGVHVSDVQREAIEGWVGAVLALGFLVRSQVTPAAKQPATPAAQLPVDGTAPSA